MDDFSLDVFLRKIEGVKSFDREKSSKEIGFIKEIEREDSFRQVVDNIGKVIKNIIIKIFLVYEDVVNLNFEDLMDGKGNFDGLFGNCFLMKKFDVLNFVMEVDLLQIKVIYTFLKKKFFGNI